MTYTSLPGKNSQALNTFLGVGIDIQFQDGPIQEYGTNGTTNEEIIQLIIDRISSLNDMLDGKYRCRENSLAITKLEEAKMWLEHRTQKRKERGVEGTDQV